MKYFIYHIPGKKIGVTRNLDRRVTQQQGYAEDEYEVLFASEDIDQISKLEIELQKSYGYPVDRTEYKNLFKSNIMKLNATEQTTTFPVPKDKLKGRLMDMLGTSWITPDGQRFSIDPGNVTWIVENAVTSHFNIDRCFIYNKAFKEFEDRRFNKVEQESNELEYPSSHHRFDLIRKWADKRGIFASGDVKTQYIKLQEEAGELAKAILKEDDVEFVDAIGDCVVVLTNLAHLNGYSIEECIDAAYNQISNRTGKMENGTFVKEESTSSVLQKIAEQENIHPDSSTYQAFSRYLKSKNETL